MKSIKAVLVLLLAAILVVSCDKSSDSDIELSNDDYLIFGHFYGFCGGETCIEIFKLENNQLSEDKNDEYPSQTSFYNGNYTALDDSLYQQVKDIFSNFPSALLTETDTVFGCPDCADGGGLYIEYKVGTDHGFWILDNEQSGVPTYLHPFMDDVHAKITLINQ